MLKRRFEKFGRLVARIYVIAAILFSVVVGLVAVANYSLGVPRGQSTQISPIIVDPMLVNITGLSTTWIGGHPFLVVTLMATNNIGIVPALRSEKVELISVNFTMSYNSTSDSGPVSGVLVQPAIPAPMTFSADELKTFSVTVGPLPISIRGTIFVQVNGWYSWWFAAHTWGTTNGGGRFDPFSGTVTVE